MPVTTDERINVALFCGGRGSSSIIRELTRWPHIKLSLLVNAYDDGLSTGELRELIPDMLGPSDFRKNLSTLVGLESEERAALQQILEFRLPRDFSNADVIAFCRFIDDPAKKKLLRPPLPELFESLGAGLQRRVIGYLREFLDYYQNTRQPLQFADCSLGNLIFAGAYLGSNHDFNESVRRLAEVCGAGADLVNVTRGESRTLVGLKQDGNVLFREAEIVGPQTSAPISDLFLLPQPLTDSQRAELNSLGTEAKRDFLKKLECGVEISPEASRVLHDADLIVYGPGTQFSSLMPSYLTRGLAKSLQESRARLKLFVANLDVDHDIQSLSVTDLVDKTLEFLGDPANENRLVTHILYNEGERGLKFDSNGGGQATYKSAQVVAGNFQHPVKSNVHSGYSVVRQILALQEAAAASCDTSALSIYLDLRQRSFALDALLQEFLELPWRSRFGSVTLQLNQLNAPSVKLPDYLRIESASRPELFSEVDALADWLNNGTSAYLVTMTGDGEYRLRDILLGLDVIQAGEFGVVYGSRTQSRLQFRSSLRSAYGQSRVLYAISWLAAFFFTAVFALRFRTIFSDPFTGFRIYKRAALNTRFRDALNRQKSGSAAAVTKLLIRNNIEIAEVPVHYRTFTGFTKASWRLWRGVRNLLGIFA